MNNEQAKQPTPIEALQMLFNYACKAQYSGPLQDATQHLSALETAAQIVEVAIKDENKRTLNMDFQILDGTTVVSEAANFCDACSMCAAIQGSGTYVIYDTVNNLAWSGPRPTNPPA